MSKYNTFWMAATAALAAFIFNRFGADFGLTQETSGDIANGIFAGGAWLVLQVRNRFG